MTTLQLSKFMKFLSSLTDDQLYEAGKIITHLVGIRHATRVIEGVEVRPGRRGIPWKKAKLA
jgi:hypothetical protein